MKRKSYWNFKKEIVSEYLDGSNTVELGEKYGVQGGSIRYLLLKENTPLRSLSQAKRKYEINESFFDSIDSQNKAYFLGLLYADGCNSPEENSVRLVLTAEDKTLLEQLSAMIYPKNDRPLAARKGGSFSYKNKTYQRKDSYCLTIGNKHISKVLVDHGLVKAKSLTLKFPLWMPKDLISHFVRGYFDGDGSLSLSGNQISITLIGTENFCLCLHDILKDFGVQASICHAKKESSVKQLVIHGNQVGRIFLEWMYMNAEIYLRRKHKTYLNIIKIIPAAKSKYCSICKEKHYGSGYCRKHHYEFIGRTLRQERYMQTGR